VVCENIDFGIENSCPGVPGDHVEGLAIGSHEVLGLIALTHASLSRYSPQRTRLVFNTDGIRDEEQFRYVSRTVYIATTVRRLKG
jgi:hypothetical protein